MCFAVILFCLGSILAQSFGGLLVLRDPVPLNSPTSLTCLSEDDDGALVWNHDGKQDFSKFKPEKPPSGNITDCAIWNSTECHARWENISGWDVVNSRKKPTDPVFDFRWEGFKELSSRIKIEKAKYQYVGQVNESSGKAVFSARGEKNVFILLCVNKVPMKGLCFWILLGGYEGKKSLIRSCALGAPSDTVAPMQGNCTNIDVAEDLENNIIDTYEWRTFRLEWNGDEKRIKVFRDSDSKNKPVLEGKSEVWGPVSHVSIRCDKAARVRFHFYEYFLTKHHNVTISTAEFDQKDINFCVELLVGLCPKCKLEVSLIDSEKNNFEIGSIHGHENATYDEAVTWRSVKLEKTVSLPKFPESRMKLEIRTFLDGDEGQGQWAIDNLRLCKPVDKTRASTIKIPGKRTKFGTNWPAVRCQKLSYSENAVVDSFSARMIDSKTNPESQQYTDLIESCGSSCANFGKEWWLCSPIGCTCSRGFTGLDCGTNCSDGFYGYNCGEMCGSCKDGACDKKTGSCQTGCSSNTYLPPACKLDGPIVRNIADTTAVILQKLELAANVELTSLVVKIEGKVAGVGKSFEFNLTKSEIPSTYEANMYELTLDTMYTARTIVKVKLAGKPVELISPETNFTTTCFKNPVFVLTPAEEKLNVIMKDVKECVYSTNPHYVVVVYALANNVTKCNHTRPKFPSQCDHLKPYTEYRVIILNQTTNATLFKSEIRTLESAPSSIVNLEIKNLTDTEVTLHWDPPLERNGIIRYYNVSLMKNKLLACSETENERFEKSVIIRTVNDTMIEFTGLYPYATYVATVTAYTTKAGEPRTKEFNTSAADIPTSMVSNLRLTDGNLTLRWDKPENCTSITGETKAARLFFTGVSDSVRNWNATRETGYPYLHLKGLHLNHYTEYRVRVHLIRNYTLPENSTSYQPIAWRTPPSAPPAVRNLETYDADSVKNTISLRWLPPDPANGEIELYRVATSAKIGRPTSTALEVFEENLKCEPKWEHFLCYKDLTVRLTTEINEIEISVTAKNKNVKNDGAAKSVLISAKTYDTRPSEPNISAIIPLKFGIVTVELKLPTLTPTKITRFYIEAQFQSTKLRSKHIRKSPIPMVQHVVPNQTNYSVKLHLLASTVYVISVVTANQRNFNSTEFNKEISVPKSIAFTSGAKLKVKRIGNSIEVAVPAVLNTTDNTWARVIVKGLTKCELTNSRTSSSHIQKTEWVAAEYEVEENRPENLTIGPQHIHGVPWNCSFDVGETYTILLEVKDRYSMAEVKLESASITMIKDEKSAPPTNLAWLSILPILGICVLIFFAYRKRRILAGLKRKNANRESLMAPWNRRLPPTPSPDPNDNQETYDQKDAPDVSPYDPHTYPVKTEDFEAYIKEALASGLLESQYKLFTRGLTKACHYGKLAENSTKNRYKDLIAYDETRVVLKKIQGDRHSDYINASYIQGYKKDKGYIATQGPKPNTVNDFWRMVWQENVRVICMLANVIEGGKTKCEQYWPEVRCNADYGDILVSNTGHEVFVDYTFRTFVLSCGMDKRVITHLHYTGWPDHGVPMYIQSLLPYLKKLQDVGNENGPVVVHCSAGVGRTGTIILCDICLNRAKVDGIIDLPAVTVKMRQNRANMVDNAQQYLLAHLAIAEYLISDQTLIPCNSSLREKIKEMRKQLPSHVERLKGTVWQDRALHSFGLPAHLISEDVMEDRASMLVPGSADLLLFESSRTLNSRSKYLTVIGVDGMKMKNQYLASPLPSPTNWSDLWRRIADENVELVIILQCPDPEDPTCCEILPNDLTPDPMQHIQVEPKTGQDHESGDFPIERLILNGEGEEPQPVTVLTCTGWGCGKEGKPPPASTLVSLWRASEKISRKERPTFVICRDGITGCGLYLALSFLLERMAVAGECDVISAVRSVRRYKPEFVQSLEQFEYLYDAAVTYDECFQTYANFS